MIDKILKELTESIEEEKSLGNDLDATNWGMQEGIIISVNEAQAIVDFINAHK